MQLALQAIEQEPEALVAATSMVVRETSWTAARSRWYAKECVCSSPLSPC